MRAWSVRTDIPVIPHGNFSSTATGGLVARTLSDRAADVVNVKEFGALGDGVTDDTSAFRAAAARLVVLGGGILEIPPGSYLISGTTYLPSNTLVRGSGRNSRLLAASSWPGSAATKYAFFENINWTAVGTLTDHDIAVESVYFDYNTFTAVGGGAHAVRMQYAYNVTVRDCYFKAGEDAVAYLGCNNTLIESCSSYEAINCPYDHWAGTTNSRVLGNYAESAVAVQFVNWNSTGNGLTNQITDGLICVGNTLVYTGAVQYRTISLSPLATTAATKRITISNNHLTNVVVSGVGNVSNVLVSNNVFRGTLANGIAPVRFLTDGTNVPSGIQIINNIFDNVQVTSGELAVIRVWATSFLITGNLVTGGAYAAAISVSTFSGVIGPNTMTAGTSTTVSGNAYTSVGNSPFVLPNSGAVELLDTQGISARLIMQNDDNLVLQATAGSGARRNIFSVQNNSSTASLIVSTGLLLQGQLRQSIAASVTAAGTTAGTATALSLNINVITTVAAGTGVILSSLNTGSVVYVINKGANTLNIYPTSGSQIDSLGTNVALTLAAGATAKLAYVSSTQWYQL